MQLQPHPKSTPRHRQYHLLSFLRHKPAHLPDICKCHSIARHPWCWLCLIPWDDVIASEWFTGVLLTTALYQYMLYSDLANLTSPDLLPRSSEALLEPRNTRLLATSTTTILSNNTNTGRSMIMVTLFLSGLWAIDPLWLERNIWMRYPDNPIPSSILPRYSYHFVSFTENIIAHCNIGTCESTELRLRLRDYTLSRFSLEDTHLEDSPISNHELWIQGCGFTRGTYCQTGPIGFLFSTFRRFSQAVTVRSGNKPPELSCQH